MRIEIRARDFPINNELCTHIERQLDQALRCFADEVAAVLVWIGNLAGPDGNTANGCRMAVELKAGRVVLEETAADLYRAIDRGARRAVEKVAKEVNSYREVSHHSAAA